MDENWIRESRGILRLIQDHLLTADAQAGAATTSAGMVDVICHPADSQPSLNYVTPRRSTAWVPTPTITMGLAQLAEQGRAPRFQYIEGLFPPQFGETLPKIGLAAESALPVWAFRRGGIAGIPAARPGTATPPDVRIRRVTPARAAQLWRQASGWRRVIDGRMAVTGVGGLKAFDLAAYRSRVPVGLARVEVLPGTAQVVALALADGDLSADLLGAAVRLARRHGGPLVFAATRDASAALAALGFSELGTLRCFASARAYAPQDATHDSMAQSVSAGR